MHGTALGPVRARQALNHETTVSNVSVPVEALRLFTLNEIAARLRVCRRTLEREIAAGRLATVRIGRSVRVLESDLQSFIATSRASAPAQNDLQRL